MYTFQKVHQWLHENNKKLVLYWTGLSSNQKFVEQTYSWSWLPKYAQLLGAVYDTKKCNSPIYKNLLKWTLLKYKLYFSKYFKPSINKKMSELTEYLLDN